MMTSTNETTSMVQNYDFKETINTLENSGLVLFPTDTLWSVGCDATNPVAIERLFKLKPQPQPYEFEILTDSLAMLKSHVQHLHPRLETLLTYHHRPLTILFDGVKNFPSNFEDKYAENFPFRLVREDFCRDLIAHFGRPILATYASFTTNEFPRNFGGICSSVIQSADHVVKFNQNEVSNGEPSVIVKLSDRDELEFIRE